MSLCFKTKTASAEEVYRHLVKCDVDFVPPLSTRVDLLEYARKIYNKAVTFEAWDGDNLVGLLAAYLNDTQHHTGYITNVSLVKEFTGRGIAATMLKMCLDHARDRKYREIELEVNEANARAIRLYQAHGFITIKAGAEALMRLTLER